MATFEAEIRPGVSIPESTKLNIGSGAYPLMGWCNIDSNPALPADLHMVVPPIPYPDSSLDEIYAGHYLEHLNREDADEFMSECRRCLKVDGTLGVVVPDTAEIMRRYLNPEAKARVEYPLGVWRDMRDLDHICAMFLFSTVQESRHQWAYDHPTLTRLLERHGFKVVREINRWMDRRIHVGAWYQFGFDAVKAQE